MTTDQKIALYMLGLEHGARAAWMLIGSPPEVAERQAREFRGAIEDDVIAMIGIATVCEEVSV